MLRLTVDVMDPEIERLYNLGTQIHIQQALGDVMRWTALEAGKMVEGKVKWKFEKVEPTKEKKGK